MAAKQKAFIEETRKRQSTGARSPHNARLEMDESGGTKWTGAMGEVEMTVGDR